MDIANDPERKNMNTIPDFCSSVKLIKNVKLGYHYLISNAMFFSLLPIIAATFAHLSTLTSQHLTELWIFLKLKLNVIFVFLCFASVIFIITLYHLSRRRKIYLVDFACHKPEPAHKCSKEYFMHLTTESKHFTEDSLGFLTKIMERSGYSSMTYAPKGLLQIPIDQSIAAARQETEMVMFGAIDELLAKTGLEPRVISIIVVNSSLFNPTPSLSAAIVNRYKLRSDVRTYNLGGMGSSAGLIAIDLAKDLLQVHHNSYALVFSTENMTRNWYIGNEKSILLTNCLFRVGGSAVLSSNQPSDRRRSKYQLIHTVRTHTGLDDKSYKCVFQRNDEKQIVGVSLSKDLLTVARDALKANITTLGPLVLPISEQLLFLAKLVARKVLNMKIKPYVPNFKLAFEHFCIHPGGKAVLDELEKSLKLSEWDMEPSRMTLYRFGNTSSSSLWYELAYFEAKGRIKNGERIWKIGFGSGFKCNSAVWRALRTSNPDFETIPWMDEIHDFPVQVPKFAPITH